MKELFKVETNSEVFPTLEECTKETEISLVVVSCDSDSVELTIESQEEDNENDPEYQEPTYVVWVTKKGITVDRLIHPYAFEDMNNKEIICTMIDMFMTHCRDC